jgi:molecular chaperone DnaK (HSP70)
MSADAPPGYRAAITRAARLAHVEVVDVIAEPVAAALALDLHTQPAERRILICDFGGGTFDVSAVVQHGLRFTPLAIGGDHWLGGDDLDDALAQGIASVVFQSTRADLTTDAVRWAELVYRCESAKRQLSTVTETPLVMRDAYVHGGQFRDLRVTIDRPWATRIWAPLMKRVRQVVEDALERAGWRPGDVDVCGLVGGGAFVPAFCASIAQVIPPERLQRAPSPALAVVEGATILTARHYADPHAKLPTLVA